MNDAFSNYLVNLCKKNGLPDNLNMGDLFFGYFHPKIYIMLKLSIRNIFKRKIKIRNNLRFSTNIAIIYKKKIKQYKKDISYQWKISILKKLLNFPIVQCPHFIELKECKYLYKYFRFMDKDNPY